MANTRNTTNTASADGHAPEATNPSPQSPLVGIFWCVRDSAGSRHILTKHCTLDAAEEYGDCLTFGPGHYEVWENWRSAGALQPPLASIVRSHEYEEWPRGRIVFDRKADRFFLYADRRIQKAGLAPALISLFHIPPARVTMLSDPHYTSPLSI